MMMHDRTTARPYAPPNTHAHSRTRTCGKHISAHTRAHAHTQLMLNTNLYRPNCLFVNAIGIILNVAHYIP